MTDWQRLTEQIAPPRFGSEVDWTSYEAELGMALPSDYKQLVETYGLGKFSDFLTVYQPCSSYEFARLDTQRQIAESNLEFLQDLGSEDLPYDPDHLLPVAGTDNGDTAYWLRLPSVPPDQWTIVVNEARGDRWDVFKGGIVSFLVAVFIDGHRMSVFPAALYARTGSFTPVI